MVHSTTTDLFTRFQQRLSAAGGESHQVGRLAEAADLIAAHPALIAGEIVVPPKLCPTSTLGGDTSTIA